MQKEDCKSCMIDDREYVGDAVQRLHDYHANNIFHGTNLIITEETLMRPLGTSEINRIIDHYFLS